MQLYDDGEYLLAEFECESNAVPNVDELQGGATVLVSNEEDGIVNYEDLDKFFDLSTAVRIQTDYAVERTLADPALKQILEEANGKVDFDPEAEQEKLREFLSGANNTMGATSTPINNLGKYANVYGSMRLVFISRTAGGARASCSNLSVAPANAFRVIRCSNCSGLFDGPSFQTHSCEYDANQKPIVAQKAMSPQEKAPAPLKKPASERIIVENQVRIRRYMKEELKFDLETGVDSSKTKKNSTKGPNECNICDRKFVHASGLVRHMEKHALDLIPTQTNVQSAAPPALSLLVVLKCNPCGRIFYDVKVAMEHVFVHLLPRDEKEQEKCQEQEMKSQLEKLMTEGEQLLALTAQLEARTLETGINYFSTLVLGNVLQCEFCDFIFADVSFLLVHSATHVPERRFECTACDLCMTTAKEASVHYQTDCVYMREGLKQLQTSPNRYFVCNVCELKFANVELLQEHRYSCYHYFPRLSESGKRLLLPCEFCTINFEYAHEIQPHYEEKHLNKKKREKELRNNGNVSAVRRLRQYLCDICGKSYTQSSHLWQHLRFHQGVKPFVCQEENCGRKFTIRPDLNDHIRKCHTGERPYHCLVCGKRFLTGSVFYQHRLIHRGERRYECDECGKRFYRADALKNHQRIHTGEKPYDCPFCTKTFRQRGDRDKHVRARHSHLDANARLMMQMQKFELETAAALKAK
ncbi:hypothetical protein KR222_003924, partial [Zaprionus bogoriensis]